MEGSKYLALAEKMISARGIPLSGSQIIEDASRYGLLPYERYETVVKTLQARIAEDISLTRNRSRFIRTGIGTYFLRCLSNKPTPYGYLRIAAKIERRAKPEHPNRILTVPENILNNDYFINNWDGLNELLQHGQYDFHSEIRPNHIPVVTSAAICWKQLYFYFKIGVHTHFDQLIGRKTVFVRKYLDEFDLDLFETDGTGAHSSTARSILPLLSKGRRMRLESGILRQRERIQFFQVAGLVRNRAAAFSSDTRSLNLLSIVDLTEIFTIQPGTQRRLEINQPDWKRLAALAEEPLDVLSLRYLSSISES